jgi:hypothetical protein
MRAFFRWRRRRYVVDGFQERFVLTHLLWLTVFLVLFAAVLFVPLIQALGDPDPRRRTEAADQFIRLHDVFWPALAIVLVVAAAVNITLSHRIAGPLYRFRQVFAALADGRFDVSTRIRRGDYLTVEAAALHRMVESLRARFNAADETLAAAERWLDMNDATPREREAMALVAQARRELARRGPDAQDPLAVEQSHAA